ncbi:MAG: cation transporter [Candidatus Nanopelagicales bacterium]
MTSATSSTDLSPHERQALGRRAQWLAGASVAYNSVEAVVSIAAGAAASSIALVGFGLDSLVEMSSGLIILWQFRHPMPETRERRALRAIAWSFFALAAYVTFESIRTLVLREHAEHSTVGIVIAALSLAIMPTLSWAQRRTGRALGSSTVVADSKQTLLCTYLSAVLLVGLLLNTTLGWWWADPLVGLVVAWLAVREGREAWRGETCGCGPVATTGDGGACSCTDEECGAERPRGSAPHAWRSRGVVVRTARTPEIDC